MCKNFNTEQQTGTLLHIAADVGSSAAIITRLLAVGGQELLDARDSSRKTARQHAIDRGHGAFVEEIDRRAAEAAPPGVLKYDAALQANAKMHKIFLVNCTIRLEPIDVNLTTHLVFSVSPALPPGLTLDPKTAVIEGTVPVAMEKTTLIVTARNRSGEQSCEVVFGVADHGQTALHRPQKWTRCMVQM